MTTVTRSEVRIADFLMKLHNVTKIQIKELLILLRFYFYEVLEQVKTNIYSNFHSERALPFVMQYAWISKLLHEATFTLRPLRFVMNLKKVTCFGRFSYLNNHSITKSITLRERWIHPFVATLVSRMFRLVSGRHIGAQPNMVVTRMDTSKSGWNFWKSGEIRVWDSCAKKLAVHASGAPNTNFRKISVWKTIWDLEFSKHLL